MNARARILIIQNMIGCMSVLKNLKKACIVYCRVSLASQKPDLENQIRAMSDFATARGYVFTVVSEVGGGMNMNRPKFMRLVNGIIDGLYAHHLEEEKAALGGN